MKMELFEKKMIYRTKLLFALAIVSIFAFAFFISSRAEMQTDEAMSRPGTATPTITPRKADQYEKTRNPNEKKRRALILVRMARTAVALQRATIIRSAARDRGADLRGWLHQ